MPLPSQSNRDHPRLRGKDDQPLLIRTFITGSPPPTRERQGDMYTSDEETRITPAHAGKTFKTGRPTFFSMDHPRSRGKDSLCSMVIRSAPGSPPLARERQLLVEQRLLQSRITPACAGKTAPLRKIFFDFRDHPRLRGKDDANREYSNTAIGSPPLARERRVRAVQRAGDDGITPACAGKTAIFTFSISSSRDHPRLRGKDRYGQTWVQPAYRITPACAGKTYAIYTRLKKSLGSPPLARERHDFNHGANAFCGITPACAGKTSLWAIWYIQSMDHPRLRGKDCSTCSVK